MTSKHGKHQSTPPLPNPNLIGLPEKYAAWRPGQAEAVCRVLDTDKRFIVLGMPTGSGKSLAYQAAGVLDEDRPVVYLTSTKGLQDQLVSDFGIADIRGMGNYICKEEDKGGKQGRFAGIDRRAVTCDEGPCLAGWKCPSAEGGCYYFDAQRLARASHRAITNYSYWMAVRGSEREGDAGVFGTRGRIVLDEAHAALDELADHLAIEIGLWELENIGGEFPQGKLPEWKTWAKASWKKVAQAAETLGQEVKLGIRGGKAALSHLRELRDLARRLGQLADARGEWVLEESRDRRGRKVVRVDPVWPAEYAEEVLFRGVEKVVLTSATIRPKTLELLGVAPEDYEFIECAHPFPVASRPVIWNPTVRVRHDMDPSHARLWVAKIDTLLRQRPDRKGVIHTVSYRRRDYLLRYSEFTKRMVVHESGGLRDSLRDFRAAKPSSGAVLVSPSVSTGFDFPGDECRYQIIGKIAFPDPRGKVISARSEMDPEYSAYVAMQNLVQTCGRGVREEGDWCENIIIDDNVSWFLGKYRHLAPKWFMDAYRVSSATPKPIER